MSMKELAISLSKLDVFEKPKSDLEQHPTDGDIAAHVLWDASLLGWIKGKKIIDLGAGTGILGIGSILMGAKGVSFFEKDASAISILKKNLTKIDNEYEIKCDISILQGDISGIGLEDKYGLVIQNPPFGTKNSGIDVIFLEKALSLSSRVITFHKLETRFFIEKKFESKGFRAVRFFSFEFPLKNTMFGHKKAIERIKVGCWFLEKQ